MNFNSLRNEIKSKNISVKELVNDFFSKIDSINPQINAYVCTTKHIFVQATQVETSELYHSSPGYLCY